MAKDLFTTHDIAKLCKVNGSTVKNWINDGKLQAYKTPGGHRRINREDLIQFLEKYEMPIPPQVKGKKLKVLVVDDEKDIVKIITRALKKQSWGLEIEPAYDGYEAGVKVTDSFPDLVILDNELPGVDGYKVLQNIKANKKLKGVKILAITGKDIPETKEKLLSSGADVFMAKPLNLKELVSTVARLLDLSEKSGEK